MKITIIHGQNHRGSTWHAADELLKTIPGEHQVSEFFLPRDLNHFCTGCYACVQSRESCPFWKDKAPMDKALREAELLIFTTPTYCMLPSGPMKSFMDLFFTNWMSHKPYGEMFSKRAVVLSTAAGAGAKKATKPLATMLLYWGVPKVYSYGLAVNASSWENMPAKKKAIILRDMQRLGQAPRGHQNEMPLLADEGHAEGQLGRRPGGEGVLAGAGVAERPKALEGRMSGNH